MYTLATADQLRSRLGLAPADNVDEERLWRALTAASARIEMTSGRHFTPRLATLAHDLRDPRELTLADDLLQLLRLSNGDGRDIDLGAVQTLPAATEGSASVLRLSGAGRFVWSGSPLAAIQVTGIWGWHERWSLAWQSGVDSAQDNPLAASATMLQVQRTAAASKRGSCCAWVTSTCACWPLMKRATACAYCARPRGRRPSPTAAARRSISISRRAR